ncbi:MAG: HYR domain-containing protein, partial [Gillisia sp.]
GVSYLWSTGATTASINVGTAGTFTVTVTGATGCTATDSVTTTLDNTVPTAAIADNNGLALSCNVPSTTLTASGGVSYLWSTGATTASINVETAGTFTITVTGENGCTATASVTTTLDNTVPAAAIANNNGLALSCNVPSTTLTASGGVSYLWSTGETTASINVETAGTFTVTVTGANGCSDTASVTTTLDNTVPTAVIADNNGLALSCNVPSTTLTASGGVSYLWSTGATTASINVGTAGTFTVTVTGATGCTATDSVTTTLDNTAPTAAIADNNGLALSCNVPSTTLTASGGVSYLWSTGETTASINVETAGTFTVIVTGANGCTATDSVATTLDNTVPAAAIANNNGLALSCSNPSTTLTASGGVSYSWSNGSEVVGTSATLEVTSAGTYTVTVTGENGCTATASVTTTVDSSVPVAAISNNNGLDLNCSNPSTTLTASGGVSYLWSTGATTASINVETAGTFTVTVTGANGCTATDSVTTTLDNTVPAAAIADNNGLALSCNVPSTTLIASGGVSYLWSTGETTASINVETAGTFTVTVTGANGCTATDSVTTTLDNTVPAAAIEDNNGLDLSCNVSSTTLTASGGVSYSWSNGSSVVGNSASLEITQAGTYTVMVTGENGCTAIATETVNFIPDTEAPVFDSVSDITVNVDAGICGATVNFEVPTATDNCEGTEVILTDGLASGSEFPVGTTTVTYTATDAVGNSVTTTFTVTVIDNEAPVIACLDNITQATDMGSATAVVTFDAPVGTDNCGATTEQTAGLPSGSEFPIGTTTNTYVVTDAAGNTATCSFTVTVVDEEDPTISCPANINMNVDAGICGAVVEFEMPVANDNSGNVTVTQTAGPASGEVFPVGTTTVSFTATDEAGNTATCSFTVTVNDNEAPVFNSVSDITVNVDAGICGATVNYEVPTASDNCVGTEVTLTEGLASGSEFPVGTTTVTYTATDAAGNTVSVSFTVTVIDNEAPVIACIDNISQATDTGAATAVVTFEAPVGTDNCGATTEQTAGLPSGSEFPIGTTTNTYVVTDAAGNTATCSFTVTVTDEEDPTITCPANINMNVDAGICGAVVEFEMPVANDNSGNVTVTQTAGPASGEVFPVGTTTVSFTATDESGNTATCSFTVTVNDNEAPVFNSVSDITVNVDAGICGATLNFEVPTATDNCAGTVVTLTGGLAPGSEFPVGTTTVTYTATDAAGNTTTISFTVTVVDNIAPVISCNENISVDVEFGVTSAVVTYNAPTATDNCPGTTIAQREGLSSGSEFPVGTTTNTFIVTDAAGNTATCSFTVTVVELPEPTPATPVIVEVVQPTCEVPTGTIEVETEEGLTYSINGTDYQESGFFSDLEPGTYSITARNSSGVVSEPVQVTLAEPSATLNITTFVELCNDLTEDVFDLFDLIAEGSDQTGTWMDTSQTGELNGSIIDPKNFAAGRYTFTYVVAGGCPSSTEVTVEIDRCFTLPCNPDDIKISKAVTPNSDGFNDFFMIDDAPSDPTCFTYNVKIFNRWGAEIFSAVNYNNNWDGQSNRSVTSSNQLPSGTYFYIVDVKDRSNGNHIKSIQSYIYLGTK